MASYEEIRDLMKKEGYKVSKLNFAYVRDLSKTMDWARDVAKKHLLEGMDEGNILPIWIIQLRGWIIGYACNDRKISMDDWGLVARKAYLETNFLGVITDEIFSSEDSSEKDFNDLQAILRKYGIKREVKHGSRRIPARLLIPEKDELLE